MMGSSPVANPVCWGSIIAIPLNLTIPLESVSRELGITAARAAQWRDQFLAARRRSR